MKELLEEFARLSPKEWGAGQVSDTVCFLHGVGTTDLDLASDRDSSDAIIFLWDWLESKGMDPLLRGGEGKRICVIGKSAYGAGFTVYEGDEAYSVSGEYLGKAKEWPEDRGCFEGSTRIEALSRACIAVLKEMEK